MTSSGKQPPRYFQWETWDVEWRHEDGTSKRRPALLISTTACNDEHEELWFVKISSRRHDVPYVVELTPNDPAFAQTGLTKTSYFYIANIQKVHKSRIYKRRGTVGRFTALLIDMQIRKAAGWTAP